MNLTDDGFSDFSPKIGWCTGCLLKLKLPFWKRCLLWNSVLWLPLLSSQWRSSVQPSCMQPWPENHPWCFNCRALHSTACFKCPWETTRCRWNSDGLSALIGVWFGGWKIEEPWKCLIIMLISALFHLYPFSVSVVCGVWRWTKFITVYITGKLNKSSVHKQLNLPRYKVFGVPICSLPPFSISLSLSYLCDSPPFFFCVCVWPELVVFNAFWHDLSKTSGARCTQAFFNRLSKPAI